MIESGVPASPKTAITERKRKDILVAAERSHQRRALIGLDWNR